MTPEHTRNSSVTFIAALTTILLLAVAFAARAGAVAALQTASANTLTASAPPMFQPQVQYDTGGLASGFAAVGDLNGDGKLDIVVTNHCINDEDCPYGVFENVLGHGTVGVLLGNGDGTFQPVVTYDVGYESFEVAVADFNGDGRLDVVALNHCSIAGDSSWAGVVVLFGNGDGTFPYSRSYDTGGWCPSSLAVGDVNRDGRPDLVVANTCYAHSTCEVWGCTCEKSSVGVLLNDGNGGMWGPPLYLAGWGGLASIGDVNGDGMLDLLITSGISLERDTRVFLGNGDGTFQSAFDFKRSLGLVRTADFNGDGVLDLLVGQWEYRDGAVLLGNGDGTFQPPVSYGANGVPVGDVNGDGKVDLVWAHGTVDVLMGNGDGTFQNPVIVGSGRGQVVMADLNGDGRPDLVLANDNGVGVAIGNKAASTTTLTSSLNPSFVGHAVTFSATVKSIAGPLPNGEIITFSSGATVLGTAPLREGVASLAVSSLLPKTQVIRASYAGKGYFKPSTGQVTQVVNGYATSTTLASSLNPSLYGQPVTWVAMVTTAGTIAPTGNVVFRWSRDGQNHTIGTAPLNVSGMAMLIRSNLNADPFGEPYPLVAVYSGDSLNLGSTSAALSQQVLQTKTAASIRSSVNPSGPGQVVTFTATITSPTVTPTGPVTFTAGKQVLGTAQIVPWAHKATLAISTLPVGSTVIRVTYLGDSNIAKSSASLTQTIK